MRTKITAFFTVLILLALTGCNNTLPKEDKPQPFSFSESHNQSFPESEAPAAEEKQEVETTPEQPQDSEPEKKIPPTEESTALPNRYRLFLIPGRQRTPPICLMKRTIPCRNPLCR